MAHRRNGLGDECGVTALSRIGRSEQPQSLLLCRSIISRRFPRTCRLKKALASEYPALPLTEPSTWEVRSEVEQCWFKAREALLVCARSRLRDMPARA